MYLDALGRAGSPDFKNMIVQGFMMNFWYDSATTIASLRQLGALDEILSFMFTNLESIKKDFEIKKLLIGFSALTMTPGTMDDSIRSSAQ